MFTNKNYHCICHGCGTYHIKVSEFMSVPMMFAVDVPDGKRLALPCLGCKTCMGKIRDENGKPLPRELNPIARAFDKGMTPAAIENAKTTILALYEADPKFYEK